MTQRYGLMPFAKRCIVSTLLKYKDGERVASAYYTVFEPAVIMIAGVIPVALFAKERKAIYRCKGEHLKEVVAREERQRTLTKWQLSFDKVSQETDGLRGLSKI